MIRELSDIMEFYHVVRVEGGNVSDKNINLYAPECIFDAWGDGVHIEPGCGWELLTGFSGQYMYSGPIMHPSEYIGGYMEQYILENDGYYVSVVCEVIDDEEPAGWAVAYRPL